MIGPKVRLIKPRTLLVLAQIYGLYGDPKTGRGRLQPDTKVLVVIYC